MAAVGTRAYDAAVADGDTPMPSAVAFTALEQVRACAYRSAAIQQTHRILTLVLATNFVLVFLPLPFLFSFLGIHTRFLRSWTPKPYHAMRLFVTHSCPSILQHLCWPRKVRVVAIVLGRRHLRWVNLLFAQ